MPLLFTPGAVRMLLISALAATEDEWDACLRSGKAVLLARAAQLAA